MHAGSSRRWERRRQLLFSFLYRLSNSFLEAELCFERGLIVTREEIRLPERVYQETEIESRLGGCGVCVLPRKGGYETVRAKGKKE